MLSIYLDVMKTWCGAYQGREGGKLCMYGNVHTTAGVGYGDYKEEKN